MASIHENFPGVPNPTPVEALLGQGVTPGSLAPKGLPTDAVVQISIQVPGEPTRIISLPPSAIPVVNRVLTALAKNKPLTLIPPDAEFSAIQAADFLNVSRQFVIALMETGKIPFRKVGPFRFVFYRDLMSYRQENDKLRQHALDELVSLGQEMNPDY
jgi:hypothetical protein